MHNAKAVFGGIWDKMYNRGEHKAELTDRSYEEILGRLPEGRLELESLRALLDDGEKDTRLWLQVGPSAEERVYIYGMQMQISALYEIVTRRLENRSALDDNGKWVQSVRELLFLHCKGVETHGTAFSKLARLTNRLGPEQKNVAYNPITKCEPPMSVATSWHEIEISFSSDERIQICRGDGSRETHNYGEFGFEDKRSGKQNLAWCMLLELAKEGGTLPRPPAGRRRAFVQKRIEEIREILRNHFGIEGDPIPFNGDTYQTSFKISRRRCYDA
jgi:hypothetical protein